MFIFENGQMCSSPHDTVVVLGKILEYDVFTLQL